MLPVYRVVSSFIVLTLCACAAGPVFSDRDPEGTAAEVCAYGATLARSEGSVWMQAKNSKESGRFSADADARVGGGKQELRLEVVNPLGGTEGVIEVRDRQVLINGKPQARETWGGIPLQLAPELFLGRFPCWKSQGQARVVATWVDARTIRMTFGEAQKATVPWGEATYRLKSWNGKPWPDQIRWVIHGVGADATPVTEVSFEFEDPEPGTGLARKWSAVSAHGEVKIKWRERRTTHLATEKSG